MFSDDLDVFEFINSKDIKAHLKNSNYKFNTLEATWLVYQCNHIGIDEKHNAFEKIIQTMPDCEVPERMNTVYKESLHQYLKDYVATENMLLNSFIKDIKNYVFDYMFFDESCGTWFESDKCYYNFEKCFKGAIKETRELKASKFKLIKRKLGTGYKVEVLFVNEKAYDYTITGDKYEKYKILYEVFDGLWFDFPTPFKKGDILCEYDELGVESNGFCKGPFVVKGITPERIREGTRKYGDSSDMNAWGYFIDNSGRIYSEVMFNYMNLEFYRGDLNGKKKVLKALSNFIAEEIDIALFANAYHYILCEENLKQNMPQGYTDEGLYLAGVKD